MGINERRKGDHKKPALQTKLLISKVALLRSYITYYLTAMQLHLILNHISRSAAILHFQFGNADNQHL